VTRAFGSLTQGVSGCRRRDGAPPTTEEPFSPRSHGLSGQAPGGGLGVRAQGPGCRGRLQGLLVEKHLDGSPGQLQRLAKPTGDFVTLRHPDVPGFLVIMIFILDSLPSLLYIIPNGGDRMANQTLGNRLKVGRAEHGLSQEQLADLVGVTRQTISAIETERYCPSALLAFLLAKKLEKRVDELFFLKGETP